LGTKGNQRRKPLNRNEHTLPWKVVESAMGTDMAFGSIATDAARKVTVARADERALALAPIIAEIRASGITTPYAIAAALTQRGIPTARGHKFWLTAQVHSILTRLDRLKASPEPPVSDGAGI
jgi:hypothetical protein